MLWLLSYLFQLSYFNFLSEKLYFCQDAHNPKATIATEMRKLVVCESELTHIQYILLSELGMKHCTAFAEKEVNHRGAVNPYCS